MKHAKIQDLTVGSPLKVLSIYAIPMLISMFFQQAYNLVDSWIAGNYIGAVALGAVGTCYPLTVFLIAIASGLSLGSSIFCSQTYGKKEYGDVKTAVKTSILAYLPASVVISISGILFAPTVLKWLSVPVEAYDATRIYLRIYMIGFTFQFWYNIVNGVLTGLGNSRTPLYYLIISTVCNIILDYVFIVIWNQGVAGLALATIISQLLSAVLTSFTVFHILQAMPGKSIIFSGTMIQEILKLGVPSMIQHILMSLGQISLQNVINSYGVIVMAGYSVAFRINGIIINSLMALSNALSGFIAQNKGAEEYGRIREGVRVSTIIAYIFSAAVILILFLYGEGILSMFIKKSDHYEEVIAAGMGFIRIVSPFYLGVCLKIVYDGALRGIGAMNFFMFATMSDVVVRVMFGSIFSKTWGLNGVWAIWPTAWIVGTILSVGLYYQYCHTLNFIFHSKYLE
ncbi:MAG: MATE family efflux transporter [Brotaphodocola sp.]